MRLAICIDSAQAEPHLKEGKVYAVSKPYRMGAQGALYVDVPEAVCSATGWCFYWASRFAPLVNDPDMNDIDEKQDQEITA